MILFYQFTIFLFRSDRILPLFQLDDALSAVNGHPSRTAADWICSARCFFNSAVLNVFIIVPYKEGGRNAAFFQTVRPGDAAVLLLLCFG
ncbi:hypothetical protein [Bacillus amyloliquefaciens]|uniref:hypothetical protein n=1 Tax=Bacillus amyloliquefaciens TaxID=1390 RepID=UPI003A898F4F